MPHSRTSAAEIGPLFSVVRRSKGPFARTCDSLPARRSRTHHASRNQKNLSLISTMTKPIALISGITGQDGSYLAELLLERLRGARHQAAFVFVQYRTH